MIYSRGITPPVTCAKNYHKAKYIPVFFVISTLS